MSTPESAKTRIIGIDASRANRAQRTGVEWYAFHLIQRLKTVIPSEQRVVLYSEEPLRDGLEQLPPNWESRVLTWPVGGKIRGWTIFRLSWEMLVRAPHLFFVPAYVPPPITPRRTVVTLHDAAFITMPEAYSFHGRWFLWAMYWVAILKARILTVSQFSKDELLRLFKPFARDERIHVTHLGFDAERYKTVPPEEITARLQKYSLAQPYFLFVGRLETKKNLAGLLRAFRAYRAARPDDRHKLVLVGKPGSGYKKDIAELTEDIKPHVLQLGYVAAEDMGALYAGATALTFVSLFEGFGIPMLEAFASGTPVLGSNATSFPEVAGDAALLVDPHDSKGIAEAMARLADDAAFRAELREKGFRRVQDFSWDATAQKTWAVLKDTLCQP